MKKTCQHVLLTGATGYLGKHLLARLLCDGHQVTALVRRNRKRLRARINDALESAFGGESKDFGPRLSVLEGDVTKAHCGLDAAALNRLGDKPPTSLLHCAGVTHFQEHLREQIFRGNLHGSKNAWLLCETLGIGRFVHISTAYVAGDTTRPFASSSLDLGQGFHNPYEASKFEAEKWLGQAQDKSSVLLRIYRPSIIVGGNPLGESNSANTVYTFLKATHFVRECALRDMARRGRHSTHLSVDRKGGVLHVPLRIAAAGHNRVNLVAMEAVLDRIAADLTQPTRGNPVISLLGTDLQVRDLAEAFSTAAGIEGIELVAADDFRKHHPNRMEAYFARTTRVYTPYLFSAPNFVREELGQQPVDIAQLARDFIRRLEQRHDKAPASLGKLAMDTLSVNSGSDYLYRFATDHLGEAFLQKHPFLDARISFCIDGHDAGETALVFHTGSVAIDTLEGATESDCCYRLDDALFRSIVSGDTDMKAAFFDGQIQIEGNREMAMKFAFLLDQHLRHMDADLLAHLAG